MTRAPTEGRPYKLGHDGMPGAAQKNAARSAQMVDGGLVIFRLLKETDGTQAIATAIA